MSILSSEKDGAGFYYGYLPGDSRRIDIRFGWDRLGGPSGYEVYIAGEKLNIYYLSKEQAENEAIKWLKAHPETD